PKEVLMRTDRIVMGLVISLIFTCPLFGQLPLATGSSRTAASCSATLPTNANQLALLRWFNANVSARIATGGTPLGMAYDGSNMWIVDTSTSVAKIRASDGTVLGKFTVGNLASYVAFDGFNVWVTNLLDNTVSKLRASDGKNLGTFPTGTLPLTIAFD